MSPWLHVLCTLQQICTGAAVVQSYFKRWWDIQESGTQDRVRALIRNEQLQFAGGGWVSNDEAICSYDDIIDQLTLGHRCYSQRRLPAAK